MCSKPHVTTADILTTLPSSSFIPLLFYSGG
uniref:Uncharacterized protein n=1 Tax=Anguilla anguilla TaxID=7936 RepID=A0A0E9V356_ANGAN